MMLNLAPEEEMVAYLKSVARTNTPEQDMEFALRRTKYDLTPQEWTEVHSHEPYGSAA